MSWSRLRAVLVCLLFVALAAGCGGEAVKEKTAKSKSTAAKKKPESNGRRRVQYREPRYTDKKPEEWIARFDNANPHLQEQAVSMLVQYGPEHVPTLIEMVKAEKSGVRRMRAMRALGQFGAQAEQAVPVLVNALLDGTCEDRDVAADSLGKIGKRPEETIPALMNALRDPDGRVRTTATAALSEFGEQAAPAVPRLIEMLQGQDRDAQAYAADALGAIGPPAQAAVPALKEASRCGYSWVEGAAKSALGKIGGG